MSKAAANNSSLRAVRVLRKDAETLLSASLCDLRVCTFPEEKFRCGVECQPEEEHLQVHLVAPAGFMIDGHPSHHVLDMAFFEV